MNLIRFPNSQDQSYWLTGYEKWISRLEESSQDAYIRITKQFMMWVESKPGGQSGFNPDLFTRTAVESYIQQLDVSISHKTRVKSALSSFAKYLMSINLLERNPAADIEIPVQALLAPRELSEDQRYVLKNLVERENDPRSDSLFALGYWAGCRVSDVSHLKLANIVIGPKNATIYVGFKGKKYREIPVLNQVRKALQEYIEGQRKESKFSNSPYLFPSQRGERLTEKGIHHWLRALKSKARKDEWELIKDITFHDLRHDFAHRAREADWPIEYIAVYLGHIKKKGTPAIETTVRYTQPSLQSIRSKLQDVKG